MEEHQSAHIKPITKEKAIRFPCSAVLSLECHFPCKDKNDAIKCGTGFLIDNNFVLKAPVKEERFGG
jgi:hypothetical protein